MSNTPERDQLHAPRPTEHRDGKGGSPGNAFSFVLKILGGLAFVLRIVRRVSDGTYGYRDMSDFVVVMIAMASMIGIVILAERYTRWRSYMRLLA